MEIRIGVSNSMREIEVELEDDADRAKVLAGIEASIGTEDGVLRLTDRRGRDVIVPAAKVAYVEVGTTSPQRSMGFHS